MAERLQEVVQSVQAARTRVLGAVDGKGQEALDRRPSPDAWSPGEILHHLLLMEKAVVRLLERLIAKAERDGAPPGQHTGSLLGILDSFDVEYSPAHIQAPEGFKPTPGVARQELLGGLAESRATFLELAARAEHVDLGRVHFPHPVLGLLDGYQWMLYLGQHELRHLHQMERIP